MHCATGWCNPNVINTCCALYLSKVSVLGSCTFCKPTRQLLCTDTSPGLDAHDQPRPRASIALKRCMHICMFSGAMSSATLPGPRDSCSLAAAQLWPPSLPKLLLLTSLLPLHEHMARAQLQGRRHCANCCQNEGIALRRLQPWQAQSMGHASQAKGDRAITQNKPLGACLQAGRHRRHEGLCICAGAARDTACDTPSASSGIACAARLPCTDQPLALSSKP